MLNKKIPDFEKSTIDIAPDGLAFKESASIEDENLKKEAQKNEHTRRERLRNHAGCAGIIIFWLISIILITMIICWGWNILAPEKFHFLNSEQFERIQTILFAASIVEMLPVFIKKYL